MRCFLFLMVLLVASGPAWAGSFYINSKGARVELVSAPRLTHETQAVERVFLVPGSESSISLGRQIMVRLHRPGTLGAVLQATNLSLKEELGRDKTLFLCEARDADAVLAASVTASALAEVKWALPDFSVPVELYHRPNDTFYSMQWHHDQPSGVHIGSEAAWDITMGDPSVVVAVIDTGFDNAHPDFDANRLKTGYNSATGSSDVSPGDRSADAHGTVCAGAIAASADNNEGVVGICPGCSLLNIKMMDGRPTSTQISNGYKAITYASQNGASVISCSWGLDPNVISQADFQPYYDAIKEVVSQGRGGKGAVILFASGNGGGGVGGLIQAAELQNMPEVMTVGGTGPDDYIVDYSDYGPNISVVAPTGYLDYSALNSFYDGPQIVSTDTTGSDGYSRAGIYWMSSSSIFTDTRTTFVEPDTSGNYSAYFSGTSASCPIAAGVVALVFSANPDLTGAQARTIVEQTADKVGGASYDSDGHHDRYGFGRVNSARAVRVASLGLDNADGAQCAEDLNCAHSLCAKTHPDDATGTCGEATDGGVVDAGPDDGGSQIDAGGTQTDAGWDAGGSQGDPGADQGQAPTDLDSNPDGGLPTADSSSDGSADQEQKSGGCNTTEAFGNLLLPIAFGAWLSLRRRRREVLPC